MLRSNSVPCTVKLMTTILKKSGWSVVTLLIALPVAIPITAVLANLFTPSSPGWNHTLETVLPSYVFNTFALLVLVSLITLTIGLSVGWLIATKEFPGRKIFSWLLVLPFAAPAYVVAYAYGDLLDYAGPIQTFLRDTNAWESSDYWFPSIRSFGGAAFVLGFVLYPYVYLFAFRAFSRQTGTLTEAARSLGSSPIRTFFRVELPAARPAIAGGLALALMETAADYGVVEFFGVPTFTSGIFRAWYAQGEYVTAIKLAAWLFVIAAMLIAFEQVARRGSSANPVSRDAPQYRSRLKGSSAVAAFLTCAIPVIFGFFIPISRLLFHALNEGDPMLGRAFSDYVENSVTVGLIGCFVTTIAALWLSYSMRLNPNIFIRFSVRTAILGYALPGLVLAIGLMGPLMEVDKWISPILVRWFDIPPKLWITGTIASLIFVYAARFLTIAFNSCESGMAQIHPQLDNAARSLGASPLKVLRKVHVPLLLPAIFTASLLVFIDVIKELPATLVLRPFNFETLATRAYRLASDERIGQASTAAVTIVLLGLIPALLVSYQTFRKKAPGQSLN